MSEQKPVVVDMTKAQVMEPLVAGSYLTAVSKWETGKSAAGGLVLNYEVTVLQPDTKGVVGRKVQESLSLENEFTLGRFKGILRALGYKDEEIDKKSFQVPAGDDVMGRQLTAAVTIRVDKTGEFGDRNQVRRFSPAEAYKEAGGV